MAYVLAKNTLLLDTEKWDLVLDSAGNIALGAPPYALVQDVASAVRLKLGSLWYDTGKGVPYFEEILGQNPPIKTVCAYIEKAALSVAGVVSAKCVLNSLTNRAVSGQIKFIDESGAAHGISF